jgi:hypothetical protein
MALETVTMLSDNVAAGPASSPQRRREACCERGLGRAMNDINAAESQDDDASVESGAPKFLRRQAPYLLVLALALAGVAYTNVSHGPLNGYWEFLALLTGVVCIFTNWDNSHERRMRIRLVWTQALHWVAVLIAMNVMLLAGVQQSLTASASSLVLLILLALGAFLAGVSLMSVQLCFMGVVMAAAVPAISWLQQSLLFLIVAAVFLVGLGLAFLPGRAKS